MSKLDKLENPELVFKNKVKTREKERYAVMFAWFLVIIVFLVIVCSKIIEVS